MYRALHYGKIETQTSYDIYKFVFLVGGVKHVSSFPSFPLPFKILMVDITQTVSYYLQKVTTRKFLPFQPSDFVNIPFETHP